ncbi:hypothetical protein U8P73_36240 (plasmid) [Rhizobium beringeri]|uniref:hypothetical protein n=1 Tax=Rhizobium beringeri TaxID=3019934 RepID=UPI002DDCFBD9|nr:hypothetical protein [Rhizobium beringeri]WSG93601.1 hypothetical protein U8P73_36240 [Rhizobium beringeri]
MLAPQDITQLAELAACAEDPVAWLTEELHKRGRRRRDIKAAFKTQRMAEDARRIKDLVALALLPDPAAEVAAVGH